MSWAIRRQTERGNRWLGIDLVDETGDAREKGMDRMSD
jgi:hypothetical protein